MDCPKCNERLFVISNFCPECGSKVELPEVLSSEVYEEEYLKGLSQKELLELEEKTHNPAVQYYLGEMYKRDDYFSIEAADLFQISAIHGYTKSQTKVGDMYSDGNLIPKDYQRAFKWYEKAAEQGDAEAQCHLGFMYKYGRGAPKDPQKSLEYFQKSAVQGFDVAQEQLEKLKEN